MSEQRDMVVDTATRLFGALTGDYATDIAEIEASGLTDLLLPAADGGFGGDWGDAAAVLAQAGAHAVALPLGEVMLARRLAAAGGLPIDGRLTIAGGGSGRLTGELFTGTLTGVPWALEADAVLAEADGRLLRLDVAAATATRAINPAGEPRDTLVFERARTQSAPEAGLFSYGALLRVLQSAGALDAALRLSVDYVNGRQQFGRALAAFQAVQQLLSQFAVEVAAVRAAATAACEAADAGDASFEIAAAKLRANIAIGVGTAAAHQVHGAIGFTQDYALHPLTRRLWSWRSEFGNDAYWAVQLGHRIAAAGADAFWPQLVECSDRRSRQSGRD